MAKLTFSQLFLLVIAVSVVSMVTGAYAKVCSVELDPKKCDLPACQEQCLEEYKGVGQCAHFGLQVFHCVCIYFCR